MKNLNSMLLVAAMLFFATSCISEGNFPREENSLLFGEDTEVLLRIRTPEGFTGQGTRSSLSIEQENRIEDVTVFVFTYTPNNPSTHNRLVFIREGTGMALPTAPAPVSSPPGSPDYISGYGTFSVTLPAGENPVRLMVIINARRVLPEQLLHQSHFFNQPYENVISQLNSNVIANGAFLYSVNNRSIPMWGEEQAGMIITEENRTSRPTITLTRAVARVDVGVGRHSQNGHQHTWDGLQSDGTTVIPFELKSVHIMRPNNRFAIVPGIANRAGIGTAFRVLAPTTPSNATLLSTEQANIDNFRFERNVAPVTAGAFPTGGAVTQTIYIPESRIMTPIGTPHSLHRTVVIIGGRFNGSLQTTYYRVDFAQTSNGARTFIDVLRNHLYLINIANVRGHGESCPREAYYATSVNMDVVINEWAMESEEVFVDGTRWVRLHHSLNESRSRHAILYNAIGSIDKIPFETNIRYPNNWGMSLINNAGRLLDPTDLADLAVLEGLLASELIESIDHPTAVNDRVIVQLIQEDGYKTEIHNGLPIRVFTGHFKFIARQAYVQGAPISTLNVVAGHHTNIYNNNINFPIIIQQRGDAPDGWEDGGSTGVCFGDCPDDCAYGGYQ